MSLTNIIYKTIILKDTYDNIYKEMENKFNLLDISGNMFIIVKSNYDYNKNVINNFFDIIEKGLEIGYKYVNTIVVPDKTLEDGVSLIKDNVKYIVWFSKDRKSMYFNKDAIREKHIWKDVEWGKRAKNYNEKGKDPGNVWIPTNDDGKGKITEHILLKDEQIIERIIFSTLDNGKALIIFNNELDIDNLKQNNDIEVVIRNTEKAEISKNNKYVANDRTLESNSYFGKVIFDSSENMSQIKDESIKVIITSPPYWNLKDYFKEGQIGQESYQQYIDRMTKVWKECYNKLKTDGSLWININTRVINGETILIPQDIIKECKKIGYYFKEIIIWHKSSGIPTNSNNIVDRHEYVLIFSKSEIFSINENEVNKFNEYKNDEINKGAFWNINRKAGSVGKKYIHPAIYPNGLVERIIKCCTIEGEIVLDPFLGSGTTLISALENNRSCIGYEYNEGFKSLIEYRCENEIPFIKNLIQYS